MWVGCFNETKKGEISVRKYLSAVTTAHYRIDKSLILSPLVQLVIFAFQKSDRERKLFAYLESVKERHDLLGSVPRKIYQAELASSNKDIEFFLWWNACSDQLCVFWKRISWCFPFARNYFCQLELNQHRHNSRQKPAESCSHPVLSFDPALFAKFGGTFDSLRLSSQQK